MGNPWIFTEILSSLEKREFVSPSQSERISLAIEHLKKNIKDKGEKTGIAESKKHLSWYISGMNGAASTRNKIMTAYSLDEIESLLYNLLKKQ